MGLSGVQSGLRLGMVRVIHGVAGHAVPASTFGRKWRLRRKVGLPEDFRLYDLRHTGHMLSTESGAT